VLKRGSLAAKVLPTQQLMYAVFHGEPNRVSWLAQLIVIEAMINPNLHALQQS
jgi:hypothetical protein